MRPKSKAGRGLRATFVRKLTRWFARNGRPLPWRRTRDPYRVLVSEVMLQQTQVSRVLDYYPRFLERFPTVERLAAARPKAVMEAWDGLGYYARARNLHRTAKETVRRLGGILPPVTAELQKLPGIGRYTAGAVASFAYEKPVAAVDTNVARVIRRYFGGTEHGARSIKTRGTEHGARSSTLPASDVWRIAESMVPRNGRRAWKFNQALMELGALVCKPRKPDCGRCPVKEGCQSRQ